MKAIVFDKSGTIVDTCRVALDLHSDEVIVGVSSMGIVDKMEKGALLILERSQSESILSCLDDYTFHNFCKDTGLGLKCVYSNSDEGMSIDLAVARCKDVPMSKFKIALNTLFDEIGNVRTNIGFIYDIAKDRPHHVLSTGGCFFPKVEEVFEHLRREGWDIFIATGDTLDGMRELSRELNVPCKRIFYLQDETKKAESIRKLRSTYDKVVMVGNDTNDMMAFKEADISILVLQDGHEKKKELLRSATFTVPKIEDILDIL